MDTKKNKINSHTDLIVWQKAKEFTIDLYKITNAFPKEEQYGLTSQLRRAAVSIPSNIAEGFRRGSKKEKRQFLRIAYGSGAEIETQLINAKELGYLKDTDYKKLVSVLTEVMKILNTLIRQFKNES